MTFSSNIHKISKVEERSQGIRQKGKSELTRKAGREVVRKPREKFSERVIYKIMCL